MVLSQLPVGIQPEGPNVFGSMNYSLLHLAVFFYMEYVHMTRMMADETDAATKRGPLRALLLHENLQSSRFSTGQRDH